MVELGSANDSGVSDAGDRRVVGEHVHPGARGSVDPAALFLGEVLDLAQTVGQAGCALF